MATTTTIAQRAATLDLQGIEIPIALMAAQAPIEVTKQGISLWNESRKVRVTDLLDADGLPVEFSVQVRITRSPSSEGEMERHARVKQEKQDAQTLRLQNEQEKRDREVKYAREATRSDILATQRDMEARGNTASKVKEALELASVLSGVMSGTKQIGNGQ
jgi:hypothetical protein